jgi:hypothetical protein
MGDDVKQRYRVIQWATGSIGQIGIQSFARNPLFELVGCYVTSRDKAGKDAGELAHIAPLGIRATNDKEAIFALDADCVHYAPLHVDLDDMVRLLESGKNVVTPAGFVFPDATRPKDVARLEAACQKGRSSLHGTGIHPGFSGDLLPVTLARLSFSIHKIYVQEAADMRRHPSRAMVFDGLGFGREPGEARAKPSPIVKTMEAIFRESQMFIADALGLEVDDYSFGFDVATAKRRLEIRSGVIEKGHVAGMKFDWTAWAQGKARIVFNSFWKMDDDLDPSWDIQHLKYGVIVEGYPSVRVTLEPGSTFFGRDVPEIDPGLVGRIWTAMNGVNVIPAVCEAKPGIAAHFELGLVRPRGLWD